MDHYKRMRNWRHTSFLGHTSMGMKHMRAIQDADSTTEAAKQKAGEIYRLLEELKTLVKERVDD